MRFHVVSFLLPPAPEGAGGGWLLILVIRNGIIHGIVNLWLVMDNLDDLADGLRDGKLLHYLVGWWFVGAGVLAPTGAVHIDLFGIDEMLKFV